MKNTTLVRKNKLKNNMFPNNHTGEETSDPENMTTTTETTFSYPSSSFTTYLNEHRISSDRKNGTSRVATHMNMCQPFGKFAIPQNEMNKFMTLYENELKRGSSMGIVENPLSHLETPLVVDFDFKYKLKNDEKKKPVVELRKHDYKTIREIVAVYNRIYNEHFYFRNLNDKTHCYFFVTEREERQLDT